MRRFLCPILLLATLPAHARFCDPSGQSLPPQVGGQECTTTQVAHPDPLSGDVVSDYQQLYIEEVSPGAIEVEIELAALAGSEPHDVTLLELGIDSPASQFIQPGGGILSLIATRAGSSAAGARPQLGWTWFEGSAEGSVLDSPPTWLDAVAVDSPRPLPSDASVKIEPYPDWCHVRVTVNGYSNLRPVVIGTGTACAPLVLRVGVMGNDLEEGMAASFHFTSQWLISEASAQP